MGNAENRERYLKIANELGELLVTKNAAYGDSFVRGCEILRILYPNGVSVDQFPDMLALIRVVDKMFRVATDRDALGESPWRDVSGYAILATDFHENRRQEYDKGLPAATCSICKTQHQLPELKRLCAELWQATDKTDKRTEQTVVSSTEFKTNPWPGSHQPAMPHPRICKACGHDHAREAQAVEGPNASCLYMKTYEVGKGPVYCGCLGPTTGPAPDRPVKPGITAEGVLQECPGCHGNLVKNGRCLVCGPLGVFPTTIKEM